MEVSAINKVLQDANLIALTFSFIPLCDQSLLLCSKERTVKHRLAEVCKAWECALNLPAAWKETVVQFRLALSGESDRSRGLNLLNPRALHWLATLNGENVKTVTIGWAQRDERWGMERYHAEKVFSQSDASFALASLASLPKLSKLVVKAGQSKGYGALLLPQGPLMPFDSYDCALRELVLNSSVAAYAAAIPRQLTKLVCPGLCLQDCGTGLGLPELANVVEMHFSCRTMTREEEQELWACLPNLAKLRWDDYTIFLGEERSVAPPGLREVVYYNPLAFCLPGPVLPVGCELTLELSAQFWESRMPGVDIGGMVYTVHTVSDAYNVVRHCPLACNVLAEISCGEGPFRPTKDMVLKLGSLVPAESSLPTLRVNIKLTGEVTVRVTEEVFRAKEVAISCSQGAVITMDLTQLGDATGRAEAITTLSVKGGTVKWECGSGSGGAAGLAARLAQLRVSAGGGRGSVELGQASGSLAVPESSRNMQAAIFVMLARDTRGQLVVVGNELQHAAEYDEGLGAVVRACLSD